MQNVIDPLPGELLIYALVVSSIPRCSLFNQNVATYKVPGRRGGSL